METRGQPSTEGEQVMKVQEQDEWMTPIVSYLKEGRLPKDRNEARKVQIRAAHLSLLTMSYTDKDIPSLIFDMLTRKMPIMYFKRYTKGFAVTTWEQGLW